MMRLRALGFSGDKCCLPSPYRTPKRVAGMAFNFSQVEVAPHAAARPALEPALQQDQASGRGEAPAFLFGIGLYSPAM